MTYWYKGDFVTTNHGEGTVESVDASRVNVLLADGRTVGAQEHTLKKLDREPRAAGWEAEQGQGMKFDQDKPRMDLLDAYATEELAKVLTFGAKKYAPHNWRKGISYARLIAAALRHIYAFARGEDHDPETGLPHPAHAMCCMMFLIWMMKERRDQDDRWKAEPKKLTPQQMKDLLYGKEK